MADRADEFARVVVFQIGVENYDVGSFPPFLKQNAKVLHVGNIDEMLENPSAWSRDLSAIRTDRLPSPIRITIRGLYAFAIIRSSNAALTGGERPALGAHPRPAFLDTSTKAMG